MGGLGMRLGLQRFARVGANVNLYPNDWYDPDFLRNYPDNATISSVDATKTDFAWARTDVTPMIIDGFNCVQYALPNTSIYSLGPSFTRTFLASKGYEDGDTARIGFWLKVPLASPTKTYRLYKGGSSGNDPVITIDNSDWNWYEVVNDKVITSDTWQTFYIALRDGSAGEKYYVRGLTLVNTTKDEWVGERISYSTVSAQKQSFLNLNGHFSHLPSWSYLFTEAFEQNGNPFTAEQITIEDLGIKGARFTGVANTQLRMNLYPFQLYLDEIKDILNYHNLSSESGYFNIGFYVEVQSEMAWNGFGAYTNLRNDTGFMAKIPYGERVWVETGPIPINAGYFDGDGEISLIQLNVTAVADVVPVLDVYGVTVSVDSNPMKFRVNSNSIASGAKYKDKIIASYGDSITGNFGWQKPILINHGVLNHHLRGIGGSTVKYNSTSYAWVTLNGEYIGRPPNDSVPAGTEGIDYLEVYQGMCNQERIDTIPVDTEVLFVMAGSNDYGQDAILGTIGDAASDLSGATFYAAYKSMIDKLQLRLPEAEIIIINFPYKHNELTETNENGDSYEDFRVAVRNLAALYGLKIIETTNLGVDDSNWASYSDDEIHPNHKYNQLIGYKILEEL